MEIWIIGGAVVVLMAYVSTKIKKSAAAAYGRETIETEYYSVVKPEGFICPVDKVGDDFFHMHSQTFGETEATESFYKAEASLDHRSDTFETVKTLAVADGAFAIEEVSGKQIVLRGVVTENGSERKIFRKIVEAPDSSVFDLTVRVLCEYLDEFQQKADEMLASFTLKR